jgi:type I restriction enzyme S subunit
MSFPRYSKYKPSDIDWLQEIPAHWRIARLKQVAELRLSNVDKHAHPDEAGVWLCNYLDVYRNERITSRIPFMRATASAEQIERLTLRSGDCVITKDSEDPRDIGVPTYVAEDIPDLVCGYHLAVLRPRPEILDGLFLHYLFKSDFVRSTLQVASRGLTRYGIGKYTIDNMAVGLAPLPEQCVIAAFLDRETAKIDVLVEEQNRLIELLKEKRQAVISHAVTKGLDPNAPMKHSGVEWLGDIPAHWQLLPLKTVIGYQEGPGIMAVDFEEQGVPLVRVSGVQGQWVTLEGANWLNADKVERRWRHFRLRRGDLVLSASASLGTIAEVGDEAAGAIPYTGLIRLFPIGSRIVKDHIRYLMASDLIVAQIALMAQGATMQHFGPTHLSRMKIVLPPLREQEDIGQYLAARLGQLDALVSEAQTAITLLQERRSSLISDAVTGKIDVRGLVPAEAEAEAA